MWLGLSNDHMGEHATQPLCDFGISGSFEPLLGPALVSHVRQVSLEFPLGPIELPIGLLYAVKNTQLETVLDRQPSEATPAWPRPRRRYKSGA